MADVRTRAAIALRIPNEVVAVPARPEVKRTCARPLNIFLAVHRLL